MRALALRVSRCRIPGRDFFFLELLRTLASNPVEDRNMANTANRLELYGAIPGPHRAESGPETGDEFLGASIERVVIDTQFQEIENEILEDPVRSNPGCLRRRRGEA